MASQDNTLKSRVQAVESEVQHISKAVDRFENSINDLGKSVTDNVNDLRKTIDGKIDTLTNTVNARTSTHVVTWGQTIPIVAAFLTIFFAFILPAQINSGISNNNTIRDISNTVNNLNKQLPTVIGAALSPALQNVTEGSAEQQKSTLSEAESLLEIAEQNRVVVPPQKVKNTGLRVLQHPAQDKSVRQAQSSFLQTAGEYITYVYDQLKSIPVDVINQAKKANKYQENCDVDLNSKIFENVVFDKCTIRLKEIGPPEAEVDFITLKNVWFIDCEFEIERGKNGEVFYNALFTSELPVISVNTAPPADDHQGPLDK